MDSAQASTTNKPSDSGADMLIECEVNAMDDRRFHAFDDSVINRFERISTSVNDLAETLEQDTDDSLIAGLERGETMVEFVVEIGCEPSEVSEVRGYVTVDRLTRFVRGAQGVPGAEIIEGEEGASSDADPSDLTPARSRARVRARTISIKRLSKRELEIGRMMYPERAYDRPQTRGECLHGPHAERPCPFASCKHHLYLDVNQRTGSVRMNFPDLEVWDLPETCTLDIADRGGITLEEVGVMLNLTRERVRQLETRGLARLAALGAASTLSDYLDGDSHRTPVTGQGHTRKGHVGVVNGLNEP